MQGKTNSRRRISGLISILFLSSCFQSCTLIGLTRQASSDAKGLWSDVCTFLRMPKEPQDADFAKLPNNCAQYVLQKLNAYDQRQYLRFLQSTYPSVFRELDLTALIPQDLKERLDSKIPSPLDRQKAYYNFFDVAVDRVVKLDLKTLPIKPQNRHFFSLPLSDGLRIITAEGLELVIENMETGRREAILSIQLPQSYKLANGILEYEKNKFLMYDRNHRTNNNHTPFLFIESRSQPENQALTLAKTGAIPFANIENYYRQLAMIRLPSGKIAAFHRSNIGVHMAIIARKDDGNWSISPFTPALNISDCLLPVTHVAHFIADDNVHVFLTLFPDLNLDRPAGGSGIDHYKVTIVDEETAKLLLNPEKSPKNQPIISAIMQSGSSFLVKAMSTSGHHRYWRVDLRNKLASVEGFNYSVGEIIDYTEVLSGLWIASINVRQKLAESIRDYNRNVVYSPSQRGSRNELVVHDNILQVFKDNIPLPKGLSNRKYNYLSLAPLGSSNRILVNHFETETLMLDPWRTYP